PDGGDHVGDALATRDQCRSAIDVPVPDLADLVVPGVTGSDHLAKEAGSKGVHGVGVECGHTLPSCCVVPACRTAAADASTGSGSSGVVVEWCGAFCVVSVVIG